MKKCLLRVKKGMGREFCLSIGFILIICDISFAIVAYFEILSGFAIGCFGSVCLLLFGAATWLIFAAAYTKEEPELPRYFTLDERGRMKLISVETALKAGKLVELRINGTQEALDALGMIDTLLRADCISEADHWRVRAQLMKYLSTNEDNG